MSGLRIVGRRWSSLLPQGRLTLRHHGSPLVPQGILNTQYSWLQGRLACQIRAAVTCCVFRKTLLLSQLELDAFTTGGVQTLMAVDADRVRSAVHICLVGSSRCNDLILSHSAKASPAPVSDPELDFEASHGHAVSTSGYGCIGRWSTCAPRHTRYGPCHCRLPWRWPSCGRRCASAARVLASLDLSKHGA